MRPPEAMLEYWDSVVVFGGRLGGAPVPSSVFLDFSPPLSSVPVMVDFWESTMDNPCVLFVNCLTDQVGASLPKADFLVALPSGISGWSGNNCCFLALRVVELDDVADPKMDL